MRSSASPPSTKRHSESRHSTDDDDVDDDVEDEEDVDVEQCSDSEDLKDSCEPPNKKVKSNWHILHPGFEPEISTF